MTCTGENKNVCSVHLWSVVQGGAATVDSLFSQYYCLYKEKSQLFHLIGHNDTGWSSNLKPTVRYLLKATRGSGGSKMMMPLLVLETVMMPTGSCASLDLFFKSLLRHNLDVTRQVQCHTVAQHDLTPDCGCYHCIQNMFTPKVDMFDFSAYIDCCKH